MRKIQRKIYVTRWIGRTAAVLEEIESRMFCIGRNDRNKKQNTKLLFLPQTGSKAEKRVGGEAAVKGFKSRDVREERRNGKKSEGIRF